MQKERSRRLRKIIKTCNFEKIKYKIKKAKKNKKPIKASHIQRILKCCPNFIGCFAEDELDNLKLRLFPCFLIVNIDSSNLDGSHWIALGLFQDRLEIMDPLGFHIFNWNRVPCHLMNFCHIFGSRRKIYVTKRIQSNNSTLCGFYCINYVIFRQIYSLQKVQSVFGNELDKNDHRLIKNFSYLIFLINSDEQ